MSSETVAKSVGKKLRYYFEVKRLEDGFDLSGVHSPQLNHPPLKSCLIDLRKQKRATLQYDGLHDRALKHYFSMPEVKTQLTKLAPRGNGELREDEIRLLLKEYMYKHRFVPEAERSKSPKSAKKKPKSATQDHRQAWGPVPGVKKHPTMPAWMYKNMPSGGKKLRPEMVGFGVPLKSHKNNILDLFTALEQVILQLKGGWPVLRSVPSQRVSRGEAHRLIDIATKILVATEKVDGMRSRPSSSKRQAAPKPFEKSQRPSTAKYTWDIHGRRHHAVKENTFTAAELKKHEKESGAYDDSFIPDWVSRQPEKPKEEPKPTKKPSPRPMSAKYRHRPAPSELPPPPPRPTVINIPEPKTHEDVTVSNATQTSDTVGIQTEKKLLEEYDHTEDEVQQGPWAEYQIYVRTGDRVGATTKADVKVTLYGEKGRTKEFTLKDSVRNKIKFQRGKEDVFLLAAHYVGKLRKIKVGHDRPELSYAWFLDGVSVYDMFDKRIYEFQCNKWLSGQDGDRKIYRELKLDRERGFVDAFDEVRQADTIAAGRDRRKNESSESHASKDDKRSLESIQGSRADYKSDSDSSTTSYSSSSTSSTSSRGRRKKKAGRGKKKKEKSPERKARTPPPVRELSPPRKPVRDDFFDKKPAGPTFTFRTQQEEENSKEEFLTGYKAGLEAASADKKHHDEEEGAEKKRILQGPTIHDAARLGNLERMQQLLKYYPEMKEAKDETGFTPLHVAVQQGRLDIVKWLTASNIDLNTETPTGYTAMHIAATNGHVNCMIVLAAMGAALTCRSVDRQTPLHLAAMNGHIECVKWLIANRSSLDVVDALGRTPLQLAEEYQHKEVADFIKKCQAESHDPNSSLYDMRTTNKGLEPIREQSSELSLDKMWKNDSNLDSSRTDAGSTDDFSGRYSQKNSASQENLETKRRIFDDQQQKMQKSGTSFLDSIRDEASY